MSESQTVSRYLYSQDIRYASIAYSGEIATVYQNGSTDIPAQCVAKAIILKDSRGLLMAIIPGPCRIDLMALNQTLHRNLQVAEPRDYQSIFADCTPCVIPCLGEAYGIETVIDSALFYSDSDRDSDRDVDRDWVYFPSGNRNELMRISGVDFRRLHTNAWVSNSFSQIPAENDNLASNITAIKHTKSALTLKQNIDDLTRMPPMPGVAQRIIQLNANPYAHANDLALLLDQDPSLTAQIVRYAQSPFYGYSGQISSVRQAISRVLGYDLVMNIALGISLSRPFRLPLQGPFGLHAFWRHALYAAALCQGLCTLIPSRQRPQPGTAYLCGLLQNIGFLVLGHLQPGKPGPFA